MLQSDWAAVAVAFEVGKGVFPQPKSAPVADLMPGLAIDMPVIGVATAGSLVFHSFDAQGSEPIPLKVVFVGGADDCISAL